MSAYACEPDRGSEPGVGWHFALAAARDHDVTVITRANNRDALERALAGMPRRPRMEYLDVPAALRFKRGSRGVRLYYVQWQRALADRARQLHAERPYDVGHHVTLAADWLPVGLTALADEVPLVWGPVGGATGTPWSLARWLTPGGVVKEAARGLLGGVGRSIVGRTTGRRAATVLALNSDVARSFARRGIEAEVMHHAVVDGTREPAPSADGAPTAVFAGRLDGWKGILLAVDAVAASVDWRLDVYGDGPDRTAAERRAAHAGVADRVRFHGAVPLARVQQAFAESDALLFPSMHDSSPFVVAEAVAAGLPVVCLRRGGPADMVRAGEGIAVDPHADDLPTALADALEQVRRAPRPAPDDRWGPEHLPARLSACYRRAVE